MVCRKRHSRWALDGLSLLRVVETGEVLTREVSMTFNGWIQITLYVVVLLALVKPLGWYMARVFEGKPCGMDRACSNRIGDPNRPTAHRSPDPSRRQY